MIQTSGQLENGNVIQTAVGNQGNASIKIQIDDPKISNRKPIAATDSQLAYQSMRRSQKHLFKTAGVGLSSVE